MYFATINDADSNENCPFAACAAKLEELTEKICARMREYYGMPDHITNIDDASNWFSGNVEDDEEGYDGNPYNGVWHWNTDEM